MKKIIIKPLEGINIVGKIGIIEIRFGMTKDTIENMIGFPLDIIENRFNKTFTLYYDFNSLQFSFSIETGLLIHIFVAYNYNGTVYLNNDEIFKIKVEDWVNNIKKLFAFDENNSESGHNYLILDIELSLWRQLLSDELNHNDYEKGIYFSSIALGEKGYLSNYEFKII